MDTTDHLALPYLVAAQAQKHVTHNEALRMLDAIVHLAVSGRNLSSPPQDPLPGDRHIVGTVATGSWTGQEGTVAAWQDGAWAFYAPQKGWLAFVADEQTLVAYSGVDWLPVTPQSDDTENARVATIGINGEADETTRLVNAAPATLLTHDATDGSHRLKINRNEAGDTASIVFQTAYGGRAEIGLAGDDSLSIKTSSNGNSWDEALRINPLDGTVAVSRLTMTGAIGIDNYFGRASDYPSGRPTGLSSFDFLMSGGINNNFAFAANANNNNEGLVFGNLANGAFSEQMRLDAITGRLGIGTSNPTTMLHVAGPVRLGVYDVGSLPNATAAGEGAVVAIKEVNGTLRLSISDGTGWT